MTAKATASRDSIEADRLNDHLARFRDANDPAGTALRRAWQHELIEVERQTARYAEFASKSGDERLKAEADASLSGEVLMATTRDDIARGNREIEILSAAIKTQSRVVESARANAAQVL